MPGMSTGLSPNNPTIVSAFHADLLHQGLVILVVLAVLGLIWNVLRSLHLRRAAAGGLAAALAGPLSPEPAARRLLRIGFGLIWIFDGVLQGQSSMPLGMAPQVIEPAAAASPTWVQHLDNSLATTWSYHPIAAPAAAVWIQIGIGIWLLVAPRGTWSRLGGLASVGWGLVVWVFGEAFGGIFAPGLTWLTGAPGAVLFYCAAGVLIALPERSFATARLGRTVVRLMGLFFVGMAVLQAWPGRGFWAGIGPGRTAAGTLVGMIDQMVATPQPHFLASWLGAFAAFDGAHGWGVNLFVVVALAAVGVLFLSGRPRLVALGVVAGAVLCLADWVLVEDLGFLGGVGTDPNSMIPMALVFVSGWLALTHPPAPVPTAVVPITAASAPSGWRERLVAQPTYALRLLAALGAVAITLVGAIPMAGAATNNHADTILSEAVDGTPDAIHARAPAFTLTDQDGQSVSLADLRGKAVALTFLDPVCTSDCPAIAQEFRLADQTLGAADHRVEFVAVDANPQYRQRDYLVAFDAQEGLEQLANWDYLTGSLAQLENVWKGFGAYVGYLPGGGMIDHSDLAYVIGPHGISRYLLDADPGPDSEATRSSFAVTLDDAIRSVLGSS